MRLLRRSDETNRRLVLVAVLVGTFLAALDTSIIGTAMPTVIGQLGGISLYSWVFSAYLLTSTTTVPIYGRLADLYGRKPIFLISAALFVGGSMLCGAAQSMPQLIAFRALQGLGAGGIIPITMTVVGDIFNVEERAQMQGLIGAVWGSSAVAGPTVGAFIVEYIDWRWVFYINLPFGVGSSLLLWLFLRERVERRRHRIDILGTLALTGSITSLLLGLLQISEGAGWLSPTAIGLFALALALLGFFVWNEARAAEPILPLKLFENRVIATTFAAGVLIGAGMFGVTSYLPLFVQAVLGGSAIHAGLVIAPFSISWSLSSVAAGRIILRFGYRASSLLGVLSMVLAGFMLQTVPHGGELWRPMVASSLFGLGMGQCNTAFIIAAQNSVGWALRGITTATVNFSRSIGGSIGVAALGTILSATMAERLTGMSTDIQNANALLDPEIRATLDPISLDRIREALEDGLANVYLGVLAIALTAFAIVFLRFPRGSVEELELREAPAPAPTAASSVATESPSLPARQE